MTSDAPAAPPRIEPATLKDIPTIIQLAEATWEPTYRFIISEEQLEYMYRVIYSPAALKRQMAEQQHVFLVARVDGEPAGFASFSIKEIIWRRSDRRRGGTPFGSSLGV